MSIFDTLLQLFGHKKEPSQTSNPKEVTLSIEELKIIHTQLVRMHTLMVEDGEDNFSKGVYASAQHLEDIFQHPENKTISYRKAEDTFLSMWGGMGSLGDFYISNAPPQDAHARQEEYQTLSISLYKFFQKHT